MDDHNEHRLPPSPDVPPANTVMGDERVSQDYTASDIHSASTTVSNSKTQQSQDIAASLPHPSTSDQRSQTVVAAVITGTCKDLDTSTLTDNDENNVETGTSLSGNLPVSSPFITAARTRILVFGCKTCKQQFPRRAFVKQHMKNSPSCDLRNKYKLRGAEHSSKQLQDVSSTNDPAIQELQLKQAGTFNDRRYICSKSFCKKAFKQQGHLKEHELTHSDKKPYVCHICKKGFSRWKLLVSHMAKHKKDDLASKRKLFQPTLPVVKAETDEEQHSGSGSGRAMECGPSASGKTKSVPISTGNGTELPHNTDKDTDRPQDIGNNTDKPQNSDDEIERPQNTGDNPQMPQNTDNEIERPHKCETCGKGFKNKAKLIEHTRTHTGEKPFKCDKCQRRFTQKSNLIRHQKKIHNSDK